MNKFTHMIMIIGAAAIAACSEKEDVGNACGFLQINMSVDEVRSRAVIPVDPTAYTAKAYVFRAEETGASDYRYVRTYIIESPKFTIDELDLGAEYKFVFMAVPRSQVPGLPDFASVSDAIPSYNEATAGYMTATSGAANDIFRKVITYEPKAGGDTQTVVLTRQNGAVEVRVSNITGIASLRLELSGEDSMYINDGRGGEVFPCGTLVPVTAESAAAYTDNMYKVRINLLPSQDITGRDGKLTIVYKDGKTEEYALKSDEGAIPVYPNQISWLKLDGSGGDFSLEISGDNINIDDDIWDGWE